MKESESERQARLVRQGRMWPWMVGALLLLMVLMAGVLVWVSLGDPSHVVEADYYDKAIHWDETRAQQEANARLGWRVDLRFLDVPGELAVPDSGGRLPNTLVVASLTDSLGLPLDSLTVTLSAFFSARAGRVLQAELAPMDGGHGTAWRLGPPGLWEFRLVATRGEDRFTWSGSRELGAVK
jgi:hypothetical protein